MRLNSDQIEIIRHAAQEAFGSGAEIFLFGSRLDDSKRGGDIDLLVHPESTDQSLMRKIRFLGLLERKLGERKIDLSLRSPTMPGPSSR
jgi:predicted nucleotidyltransferase